MNGTTRVSMNEDEWEGLHIEEKAGEVGIFAQHLADYGIDIPTYLLNEYLRIGNEWSENQKDLKAWFEGWLPDDDHDKEQVREVILYQSRTWGEYEKSKTCGHEEAQRSIDRGSRYALCEVCMTTIYQKEERP